MLGFLKGVLVVIVGLFILGSLGGNGGSKGQLATASSVDKAVSRVANNVHGSGCNVSFENYSKLDSGMSYWTVSRILGCDGREMTRSDFSGITTAMYAWDGQGSLGANMNVMFQNDRLVTKAQFGLK